MIKWMNLCVSLLVFFCTLQIVLAGLQAQNGSVGSRCSLVKEGRPEKKKHHEYPAFCNDQNIAL